MLVLNNQRHEVPGLRGASFLEEPALALTSRNDWRLRTPGRWIRGIVLHTRLGLPVEVRKGTGPDIGWDQVLARRFSNDERLASCHIAIDADGSFACLADIVRVATYHAGQVNEITVGVEMYQASDGGVWHSTLVSAVRICDALTRLLGIQRQVPIESVLCRRFASPTVGLSASMQLAYMKGGARGRDFCGVYGHRNVTRNRGPGDPGDPVFDMLRASGYEAFKVDAGDDLDVWATRQRDVGLDPDDIDGIPGPKTRALLQHAGKPHGLWVSRPGDDVSDGIG